MDRPLILIVDDHYDNLSVLGNILEVRYDTAVSLNGENALAFVEKTKPDLILLDIMMPGMSGYEICNTLKKNPKTKNIPIIFITAKTDADSILKGFKVGGVDYICKPFNSTELLARVQTHLSLKMSIEALELYQLKLETVFQSVPEGIITVDERLNVIQKNEQMKRICPFTANISINEPLNESVAACGGECIKILKHCLKSQQSVKEYFVECKNEAAAEKKLILNASPLVEADKRFLGAVLVIRDVTLLEELENKLKNLYSFDDIIGKSDKIQAVYSFIDKISDVDANILVTGESGTGKELVVEAIHRNSCRAAGPLVRVNCSALSENILESELFGHVRGAFTGAVKDRAGRIESANGGTLFLDEIGDVSSRIQSKLLNFLERKEYEKVGDNKTIRADVRIITATHRDLSQNVRQGLFREDLYHRLKVLSVHLPPLRERKEDIPLLIRHFCGLFSKRYNKNIADVSKQVLSRFMNYSWPGNIRELKHVMEHAAILCSKAVITESDIPLGFDADKKDETVSGDPPFEKNEHLTPGLAAEKIRNALEKARWNKTKAAKFLGIHRTTLYRKMLEFNIDK